MGRTNPTFRDALRRYRESWAPFRRALRAEDKADFDRLFSRASEHAAAAGNANPADPHRAVVLSMLLSQERELRRLRERVDSTQQTDE
ncbi:MULTISPECIES: hypothetical protein [Haloferax]|uniref:DUF8156 domain-containing protein n=1 Tax=Haloferax marinum TaxID=2666143 RepID=A0A6A8G9S2_9EURY|nr:MULTISPECIES: hypothetical protein [Haloferax]KAB1198829.1 hypothetical protein Hfx1150_15375 [Haloferax sp. CBA1150]MRW97949.1 hypothetical protein [Haloferax marinum]